jgi:hypothetical protein
MVPCLGGVRISEIIGTSLPVGATYSTPFGLYPNFTRTNGRIGTSFVADDGDVTGFSTPTHPENVLYGFILADSDCASAEKFVKISEAKIIIVVYIYGMLQQIKFDDVKNELRLAC